MTVLRLGTRGSLLALAQSKWTAAALEGNGAREVSLEVIRTVGDEHLDQPLHEISGKGVFTRELDEALLSGRVHLAVHSLKDLPTVLPEGLCIAATPCRVDPRDVLVGPEGTSTKLASLKEGAVVGTSSLRRVALLNAFRRDVTPQTIRGNVDTRLRKLDDGQFDAIILAGAGLTRLGLAGRANEWLERTSWLPAPGQGALGIVTRTEDAETRQLVGSVERSGFVRSGYRGAHLSRSPGGRVSGAHRGAGDSVRREAAYLGARGESRREARRPRRPHWELDRSPGARP